MATFCVLEYRVDKGCVDPVENVLRLTHNKAVSVKALQVCTYHWVLNIEGCFCLHLQTDSAKKEEHKHQERKYSIVVRCAINTLLAETHQAFDLQRAVHFVRGRVVENNACASRFVSQHYFQLVKS